jgi:hypothetical protein
MSADLRFEVLAWLSSEVGNDAERASYGDLAIRAGDISLSSVIDNLAKSPRDSIHVSLNHLARWFADSWWRLRWEPEPRGGEPSHAWRMAHAMSAAGGGFVWPQVYFRSDGETILLSARRTSEKHAAKHTIQYIGDHDIVCEATAVERSIDVLMSSVLARQENMSARDPALAEIWQSVQEERQDPEATLFRKLEAMMGFDPGEIEADEVGKLLDEARWMGEGALLEVLTGAGTDAEAIVEQAEELRARASVNFNLRAVHEAAATWRGPQAGLEPWQNGDSLARHLRLQWNLGDGPVSDERLNAILEGDIDSEAAWIAPGDFSLGFRENGALRPAFRAVKRKESRRFAIARMLADAAFAGPDGDVLPVTNSGTARQRLQRAAAQELLCPVEAIEARLDGRVPDDEKLSEIADEFGVSALVVRTALVNKQILPRWYLPAS